MILTRGGKEETEQGVGGLYLKAKNQFMSEQTGMKFCNHCQTNKPLGEFRVYALNLHGEVMRKSDCNNCARERHEKWRQKNLEKCSGYSKKHYQEKIKPRKLAAMAAEAAKGNKQCTVCFRELPLSAFAFRPTENRYTSNCRICGPELKRRRHNLVVDTKDNTEYKTCRVCGETKLMSEFRVKQGYCCRICKNRLDVERHHREKQLRTHESPR